MLAAVDTVASMWSFIQPELRGEMLDQIDFKSNWPIIAAVISQCPDTLDIDALTVYMKCEAQAAAPSSQQREDVSPQIRTDEKHDGPSPPNWFQWKGARHKVPATRWKMLNVLWSTPTTSDSELGMAIWGEEWDETKLSSTVNRLNGNLHSTPWRVTRKGGMTSLTEL